MKELLINNDFDDSYQITNHGDPYGKTYKSYDKSKKTIQNILRKARNPKDYNRYWIFRYKGYNDFDKYLNIKEEVLPHNEGKIKALIKKVLNDK